MLKRLLFLLLFCGCAAYSFAQCGLRNLRAFRGIQSPGNIAVDEQGNPMGRAHDTTYMVFLEGKVKRIDGGYAWLGKRRFEVLAEPLPQRSVVPGRDPVSGKEISISATGSNKLWRLALAPAIRRRPVPERVPSGTLLLELRVEGKSCLRKIATPRPIELPLSE